MVAETASSADAAYSRVFPIRAAAGGVPGSVSAIPASTAITDQPSDGDRRTLVVDDHPLTRAALVGLLEQHDFPVVGEAADGEEAIERARQLQPDLVLLDLSMPGSAGSRRCRGPGGRAGRARSSCSPPRAPRRTCSPRSAAGAAGYLLKTEPPERIAEFLDGVVRGEAALSGEVARRLLDRVRDGGRLDSGVPDSIARELSAREVEVLLLLDEHLGTDEIAKRLFISEHTVRSHVKSLLRKLNVSSRREALEALAAARA